MKFRHCSAMRFLGENPFGKGLFPQTPFPKTFGFALRFRDLIAKAKRQSEKVFEKEFEEKAFFKKFFLKNAWLNGVEIFRKSFDIRV